MRFESFIIVDWSAKAKPSPPKPSKDAIWVAEGNASKERVRATYFRTRQSCYEYLRKKLRRNVKEGLRTFLGVDVIYAYPQGFAKALRLKDKPSWRAVWELLHHLVEDDAKNRNNRFLVGAELNRRIKAPLGPFWGVPTGQSGILLGPKKDFSYPVQGKRALLAERRLVEQRCSGMQPTWKLAYTGSVGSQGLMGIPYLYQLRFGDKVLAKHSKVWPFETGFTQKPLTNKEDLILHAEIWPSLIKRPGKDKIVDREQVKSLTNWLLNQQAKGELNAYFDEPKDLKKKELKVCVKEEGWVLGVK